MAGRGLQSGVSVKAGSLGLAGGTSTEDERLAAVTGREIDSGYGSSDKLSDGELQIRSADLCADTDCQRLSVITQARAHLLHLRPHR